MLQPSIALPFHFADLTPHPSSFSTLLRLKPHWSLRRRRKSRRIRTVVYIWPRCNPSFLQSCSKTPLSHSRSVECSPLSSSTVFLLFDVFYSAPITCYPLPHVTVTRKNNGSRIHSSPTEAMLFTIHPAVKSCRRIFIRQSCRSNTHGGLDTFLTVMQEIPPPV